MRMEHEGADQVLARDCWLMVLTFAVKASNQEGGDLCMNVVLSRMKESALWLEMKDESVQLEALGYLLLNKPALASRCFARTVHSNPLDLASHVSLLCWSGKVEKDSYESLLCCAQKSPDLLRNAFTFYQRPSPKSSPKDEEKRRRVVMISK